MNTDPASETDRSAAEPASRVSATPAPSPLAVHGDPSRPWVAMPSAAPLARSGIAWVRPSDLPTMIGGRIIGRGLDLKAELVRRASRPTMPRAPKGRVTKTAIASTEPPSITHRPGGISL